ncbi:MAG TPA: hypothetical protein PLO63_13750 [Syntrophales bacterium]|nr:hypothetical protein [Syntrophales bacterium]
MASKLADLRAIADESGFITSPKWTEFIGTLSADDRESLRSEIFGDPDTTFYNADNDPFGIYGGAKDLMTGSKTALGYTGLGDDYRAGAAYSSPFAPQSEYERNWSVYQNYMAGRDESVWDNPFSAFYALGNPIGTLAKESGVSSGVQNALDIAYNIGSLGGGLATEGLSKATSSEGDLIENIGKGIDEALDPLEVDYYIREAGKHVPESVRSYVKPAATAIGSIWGPIGASAGYGVGSKIAGEDYSKGLAGSALAYAGAAGGLGGKALKYAGNLALPELLDTSDDNNTLSALSMYLRRIRGGSGTADTETGGSLSGVAWGDSEVPTTGTSFTSDSLGRQDVPGGGSFYDDVLEELKRRKKSREI